MDCAANDDSKSSAATVIGSSWLHFDFMVDDV